MQKIYFFLLLLFISPILNAQTVWNGPTVTFAKAGFANPALAENQDRITGNVWITRGSTRGLYNIKKEAAYTGSSPNDTEWAIGTLDNYATLTYTNWFTWYGKSPTGVINEDAVLHLISENIYIGIRFLSWGQTGEAGGSFSYTRTTASTLPVNLKSFTATLDGNNAVLNWTTAGEVNNKYFDIEHSLDGSAFFSVGKVDGIGSSITDRFYSFTHYNIGSGTHHYRLAQYDFDGAVKYSPIVQLISKPGETLHIVPNPATTFISITASSALAGATYMVTSSAGQIIKKGIVDSRQIEVQKLPAGQYWLIVKTKKGDLLKSQFLKK